jgi:AcrR family transcriptional regulator
MRVSYQADSRRNQKARTRAAIVEAAVGQLRDGITPTVSSAAEAAKISRATAYRYFPTQEALLNEVATITPSLEPVEAAIAGWSHETAEERLTRLMDVFNRIVIENESGYRAALRVYLDTWFEAHRHDGGAAPNIRAGRRMRWLDSVLKPLEDRLPPPLLDRLSHALALTLGIDSIVIMKDVCALGNEEALTILQWTARMILEGALHQAAAEQHTNGARRSQRNGTNLPKQQRD